MDPGFESLRPYHFTCVLVKFDYRAKNQVCGDLWRRLFSIIFFFPIFSSKFFQCQWVSVRIHQRTFIVLVSSHRLNHGKITIRLVTGSIGSAEALYADALIYHLFFVKSEISAENWQHCCKLIFIWPTSLRIHHSRAG